MNFMTEMLKKNFVTIIVGPLIFNFAMGIILLISLIPLMFYITFDNFAYTADQIFNAENGIPYISPLLFIYLIIISLIIVCIDSLKKASLFESFYKIKNGELVSLTDFFKAGFKNFLKYFGFELLYAIMTWIIIALSFVVFFMIIYISELVAILYVIVIGSLLLYIMTVARIGGYKLAEGYNVLESMLYPFKQLFKLSSLKYVGVIIAISIAIGLLSQVTFGLSSIIVSILEGVYGFYLYAFYQLFYNKETFKEKYPTNEN